MIAGEEARIFDVTVHFESRDEAANFAQVNQGEIIEWFEIHGRKAQADDVIFRQVLVALLSDFCHFIFEALRSSSKGKLTVSFALLRKPLKDSLLTFEWLLADRPGFIDAFAHNWPARLDELLKNQGSSGRSKIIHDAVSLTTHPQLFDPAFLEEVRYERNAEHGLADLFDMAMHLVTTFKVIQTDSGNFNFVFSDGQCRFSQWYHLYWHLPVLLNYAIEVIEALLITFVPRVEEEFAIHDIRRKVGFLLWAKQYGAAGSIPSAGQIQKALLDDIPLRCQRCSERLLFDDENARTVFERSRLRCRTCRRMNRLY